MRHIFRSGLGVCLATVLCGAWTPPLLFQAHTTNLEVYWNFDGASPGNSSGGSLTINGTVTGAVQDSAAANLPPPFGGLANVACMQFDGTDDKIVLPADLALVKNRPGFTIAAWVNVANPGTGDRDVLALAKGDVTAPSNDARASLTTVNGQIRGFARAADTEGGETKTSAVTGAAPAPPVQAGRWDHVAVAVNYSNDSMILYWNGTAVAAYAASTENFSVGNSSNTNVFNGCIGANATGAGRFFRGRMDDLRVYRSQLSAAQVRTLCAPRAPAQTPPTPGPESVTVNWTTANQPGPDLGYNVFRRPAGTNDPFVQLNATPVLGTSYTDTTTLQGTQFEYRVRSIQTVHPGLESLDSNSQTAAGNPPLPRTDDHNEGFFEDKCACGSSAPGPALPAALAGLAALALALRRRR